MNGYELLCRCWELKQDLLHEQQMLLTTESFPSSKVKDFEEKVAISFHTILEPWSLSNLAS